MRIMLFVMVTFVVMLQMYTGDLLFATVSIAAKRKCVSGLFMNVNISAR
jgi:hypothetical protein